MERRSTQRWLLGRRWGQIGLVALWALCAAGQSLAKEPPQTARSRAAVARVKDDLTALLSAKGLSWGSPVFIRLTKEPAILEVWMRGVDGYSLAKSYPICAFSGLLGPKTRQGDLQAPEGVYSITSGRMNPWSDFHLSMNLGYPNEYDRGHGYTGQYLMIHGNCVSIGCYAMTDAGIDEIYSLVEAALRAGQQSVPVHAFPFPMTEANRASRAEHPNAAFWSQLAPIWSAFESDHEPPKVRVRNGQYELVK